MKLRNLGVGENYRLEIEGTIRDAVRRMSGYLTEDLEIFLIPRERRLDPDSIDDGGESLLQGIASMGHCFSIESSLFVIEGCRDHSILHELAHIALRNTWDKARILEELLSVCRDHPSKLELMMRAIHSVLDVYSDTILLNLGLLSHLRNEAERLRREIGENSEIILEHLPRIVSLAYHGLISIEDIPEDVREDLESAIELLESLGYDPSLSDIVNAVEAFLDLQISISSFLSL